MHGKKLSTLSKSSTHMEGTNYYAIFNFFASIRANTD